MEQEGEVIAVQPLERHALRGMHRSAINYGDPQLYTRMNTRVTKQNIMGAFKAKTIFTTPCQKVSCISSARMPIPTEGCKQSSPKDVVAKTAEESSTLHCAEAVGAERLAYIALSQLGMQRRTQVR